MEKSLTTKEAYQAMTEFLDSLYELTKSDDLAVILGSMQMTDDGSTMDPAYWDDWVRIVNNLRNNK